MNNEHEELTPAQRRLCATLRAELQTSGKTAPERGDRAFLGRPDLLLCEAEWFAPATLAPELGPDRDCWENARALAATHDSLLYAEGVAASVGTESYPAEHAWCVDARTGHVIETTWRTPGSVYLGFVISPQWVSQFPASVLQVTGGMGRQLFIEGLPEGWALRGLGHPNSRTT